MRTYERAVPMVDPMEHKNAIGRPCRVCSGDRQRIETLLVGGTSVAEIVSLHSPQTSRDSIYRHIREHMVPALRKAFRGSTDFNPVEVLTSAAQVAQRAQEIGDRAYEKGNDTLALKAGDASLRALTVLGLRDLDVLEVVAAAEALTVAVGQASHRSPELGELVAARLDANGHPAIADQLRASFHETTRKVSA